MIDRATPTFDIEFRADPDGASPAGQQHLGVPLLDPTVVLWK